MIQPRRISPRFAQHLEEQTTFCACLRRKVGTDHPIQATTKVGQGRSTVDHLTEKKNPLGVSDVHDKYWTDICNAAQEWLIWECTCIIWDPALQTPQLVKRATTPRPISCWLRMYYLSPRIRRVSSHVLFGTRITARIYICNLVSAGHISIHPIQRRLGEDLTFDLVGAGTLRACSWSQPHRCHVFQKSLQGSILTPQQMARNHKNLPVTNGHRRYMSSVRQKLTCMHTNDKCTDVHDAYWFVHYRRLN